MQEGNQSNKRVILENVKDFLKGKDPHKAEDPSNFNIPVSINGVYISEALCDLGSNVNIKGQKTV